MSFALSRELVEELCGYARAGFPEECCGFIIERDGHLQAVPVSNMQNKLHEMDPEQYPRTAATADSSSGKPGSPISFDQSETFCLVATTWSPTSTSNCPREPTVVSTSTDSSFWILAARLAARWRYPQAPQ